MFLTVLSGTPLSRIPVAWAPGYRFDSRTNSCYKFHTTPLIWTRAFVACAHEGGYLAIINSKLEHQLIKELYSKSYSSIISGNYNRGAIHLGYKSFEHLSLWMTIHGIPLSRMPVTWAPGEPDNADNSEDCLLMLPNGTLADVNCSDVYPYVCYRKKQINMPVTHLRVVSAVATSSTQIR
ncbi:hypothetical protein MSG28_003828 [Choristoneura fumiferana]|uniref:Uncharacterized protein n=1 Tax=Choristoneura fumiferana TaxID=7141 RepID=A0ACC0KG96_CHOFU|nr:hypothetical protein MSG28_003828 [Choristoneura fumiferana]